ncbi:alpha/beta hydrolase [Pantanalinema sp. GBBB05]|uniref:alpha/beta hydrolase n=1 Tax=Pantanalinema sp. GBBB05 TaxID=2604139 RepID=UPI001D67E137|nr:alpha/beta hydrolase [Pantanalinema sp. GBBB05]
MAHTNSPIDPPPTASKSASKRAALQQFKALVLQIVRWTKGFLELQKLPYIANKACEIYLRDADEAQRARCRRILQTRLELNPAQLRHFFHTSMGKQLLSWFGRFFHPTSDDHNHLHHLQDLLVQMASDPEGLSLLSFLRRFPDTQQLNLDQLLFTAQRVEWLLKETETTIATIRDSSIAEMSQTTAIAFASLPDLRQPGQFAVKQLTFTAARSPRSYGSDKVEARSLQVVCYQPDPLPSKPIPVVIQSHGFASNPEDLEPYARHLASYGYLVAAPWHPGSDTEQVRRMLTGEAAEVFQLTEFVDRPLDIHDLLDDLERRNAPEFESKLNLTAVGVVGYSFGAYTAFALAGANIQFDKLELACGLTPGDTNLSLLLQCQALGLPRQLYHLRDDRVQAILALDTVGSEVFGQAGIQKIQVPVMLIAGSQDPIAPLALEQMRIFQWLTTNHHYLALMQGKSHVGDMQRFSRTLDLQIKVLPQVKLGVTPFEQYIQALSVAFFQGHLTHDPKALAYLSPHYTAYLSRTPFDLWLISQASRQDWRHQPGASAIENREVA